MIISHDTLLTRKHGKIEYVKLGEVTKGTLTINLNMV